MLQDKNRNEKFRPRNEGYIFEFLITPDFAHSYFGAFVPSPFSFPDHSSSLEGPLSREEVVPS